ncbi:MAG: polyprenyl diphosphate synthase, partial [Patescibacteria group bacterium]
LRWCRDAGVKTLTLFAFSTENWQRAKEEVYFLMGLFYRAFTEDIKKLHENNIRVLLIGRKEGLSKKLQGAILQAEELTKNNDGCTLNLAINYGGRPELMDAFKKILKNPPAEITEETISQNLYTAEQANPDLIIRTSGEQRLSGFLTWQSAYSELLFVNHHWPEFSKDDFDGALTDFAARQRRFGK